MKSLLLPTLSLLTMFLISTSDLCGQELDEKVVYSKTVTVRSGQTYKTTYELNKDEKYRVTCEFVEEGSPIELRVKRLWKRDLKFDSKWKKGEEEVTCLLPKQRFGLRPWTIFVKHDEDKNLKVRITIERIR